MTYVLSKYSNLTQRVISAIIGAVIIIGGTAWSEWAYFIIFFVFCMLSILEFYKNVGLDGMLPLKTYGTFAGMFIYTLTFLGEMGIFSHKAYFFILPVAALSFLIKLYRKGVKKPFTDIAFTFLGICYVAVPFALLNIIAFSLGHYSYQLVIGCLFLHWASDTGAYFAGVRFGKHKLFERVSPKKSWEGSLGGTVTALGMAYLIALNFHDLNVWQWMTLAIIIIITGTYGDLVESMFKRSIEVKDSGTIIVGHGGFLDRFDGLLLSTPFIVTFLKIFL